jgi:hypothetical protein
VVLNIGDESSLREAYTEMSGRLGPRALIAPMVAGQGVEMIVGISRDEQFGPMVLLGIGGVYTEALGDAVVMCPPFTAAQAKSALQRLQLAELLGAFRGRPALALDRFCEVAARVSQMALALADCVREVDINPMRLTTDDCIALDALIVPPERIKERGD